MSMSSPAPETVTTTQGRSGGVIGIASVGPLSFGPAKLWFWKLPISSSPSSSLQFVSGCFWLFLEFRFKSTMEITHASTTPPAVGWHWPSKRVELEGLSIMAAQLISEEKRPRSCRFQVLHTEGGSSGCNLATK
ncbi:hypothetical protein ACQJBY_022294 [Aegilops geniculata]